MNDFVFQLKFGNDGELFFKEISMRLGCSIVPTYDYTSSSPYQGRRLSYYTHPTGPALGQPVQDWANRLTCISAFIYRGGPIGPTDPQLS